MKFKSQANDSLNFIDFLKWSQISTFTRGQPLLKKPVSRIRRSTYSIIQNIMSCLEFYDDLSHKT